MRKITVLFDFPPENKIAAFLGMCGRIQTSISQKCYIRKTLYLFYVSGVLQNRLKADIPKTLKSFYL